MLNTDPRRTVASLIESLTRFDKLLSYKMKPPLLSITRAQTHLYFG